MATKEANVIAAVIENKDIHTILSEDEAIFGAYADVFKFIREHYQQHKNVASEETLRDKFGELDFPHTTAPTQYYLDELKDEYVTHRIGRLLEKAATELDAKTSTKDILNKLQTQLANISRYTNTARDLDVTDIDAASDHFERLRKISEEKGGLPGISTGFKPIDIAYPTGLSGGHLIVVMGFTGRAKSFWAELLAVKAWEQGYKPMIVSLEMSPEEQRERLYALMASGLFSISDLSRGMIAMDDFETFGRQKLKDSPPFVVVSSQGISEITPNVIQGKMDMHKPDIVILDYAQLMKDNAKTQAMTPRMLNLSRECKMLGVSNDVPIVMITAVTDDDDDKRDAPPGLHQVAWSSGIEFDANLAIAIHRHDDSNLVEAVGRKNRHGPLFDFFYNVDFDRGIWEVKYDL